MPSAIFEIAIPATKWQQIYTLDREATGIGKRRYLLSEANKPHT
jgi:hypothetical protein